MYSCPDGTLYNASIKDCKKDYQCIPPTPTTTSFTTTKTLKTKCSAQGKFSVKDDTSCTRYIFCYLRMNGKYLQRNYTCPTGTRFDPKLQTCSSRFKCLETLNTVTTVSFSVTSSSFSCSKQGRFPVREDQTCRSYYYCLYLPNGRFTQHIYVCPSVLKFDPKTQSCSQNYECSESTTWTTIPTIDTSSLISSTTQRYNFTCPSTGRFSNESDISCKTYFFCIKLPSGDLEFETYQCAKDEFFDPILQTCSQSYECSADTTTAVTKEITRKTSLENSSTLSSTIASSISPTTPSNNFNCLSTGRFPDETDVTCKIYFLCVQLPNGNLGSQTFQCPKNDNFDPNLKSCSDSYECSVSGFTEVSNEATTTTSINISKMSSTITLETTLSTNTQVTTSRVTTTTSTSSVQTTANRNFNCPSTGRFSDDTDSSCRIYYLCVELPNGNLGSQTFKCPQNEKFDPNINLCSDSYQCSTIQAEYTTYSILTTSLVENPTQKSLYTQTFLPKNAPTDAEKKTLFTSNLNEETEHDQFMSNTVIPAAL